jgi:hypothetical protein
MAVNNGKTPIVLAVLALIFSGISTYFSLTAIHVNQDSARAQLFSNFQQQYSAIAAQFPTKHFDQDWIPETGTEDWLRLKRYWDLCYVEWYATRRLQPALYGRLWNDFYAQAIGDALEYPSLRSVLIDLMVQQQDKSPQKHDFFEALRVLAWTRGVSLERSH